MKFFWCQEIFYVNFDFKNGCQNDFEDNNEKSCSRFKNRVPPQNRFQSRLDSRIHPDSLGVNIAKEVFLREIFRYFLYTKFKVNLCKFSEQTLKLWRFEAYFGVGKGKSHAHAERTSYNFGIFIKPFTFWSLIQSKRRMNLKD